jgi:hypothetical protein
MARRVVLVLAVIALLPVALQARFQDKQGNQDKKSLRLLIEGDTNSLPWFIEDVRKAGVGYSMEFVFAASATEAYDARIIVMASAGRQFNPDPHPTFHTISYGYSSAAVLTPQGKLLVTLSQTGVTIAIARQAVANEVFRNLFLYYGILKPAGERAQSQDDDPSLAGLSRQPGVYYKAQAGWTRLDTASSSSVKTSGVAKTFLTWGIASSTTSRGYRGAQAPLQASERRPDFFVRGFNVSDQTALIVRVEKKRDDREVRIGSFSAFNAKPGYREQDARKVKVTSIAGGVSIVTPETELEPGEYILLLDSSASDYAYDFGIKL